MKTYYIVRNQVQSGPHSFDELKTMKLPKETLVWNENMDDWTELRNVEELNDRIQSERTPPPIPNKNSDRNFKHSSQESNDNKANSSSDNQFLFWLLAWVAFHTMAILLSYSKIGPFNVSGEYSTSEFWPFVNLDGYYQGGQKYFGGYLRNYDWSEFSIYIGASLFVFLFVQLTKRNNAK